MSITYRKCWIVEIILEDSVEIMKQSMLWGIVPSITEINASYKCSYLPVITICLCVHKNAFLMVRKDCSNSLEKTLHINILFKESKK